MKSKIEIIHNTYYTYTSPVKLNPHVFLMKPRSCSHQEIISFSIDIFPKPTKLYSFNHVSNGVGHHAFFDTQLVTQLDIKMKCQVQTDSDLFNNFVIYPFEHIEFPVKYSKPIKSFLNSYLKFSPLSAQLDHYNTTIFSKSNNNVLTYLNTLNTALYNDIENIIRLEGPPQASDTTFTSRKGACRDKAFLFMHFCRSKGLACRFTSGYFLDTQGSTSQKDLHAWVEVYLDGAGWIGFDPTCGLQVTPTHVPICTSSVADLCMPVNGSYIGEGLSKLESHIDIQLI